MEALNLFSLTFGFAPAAVPLSSVLLARRVRNELVRVLVTVKQRARRWRRYGMQAQIVPIENSAKERMVGSTFE